MLKAANFRDGVLIANCWHDSNKGDAAITTGVLNAIKNAGVADRVFVASYAYYNTRESLDFSFRHVVGEHPEATVVQTSLPALSSSVGKLASLRLSIRAACKLLFPDLLPDMEMETAVRSSRVVVSNGGLYYGFVKANFVGTAYHLFAFSYPMLLAMRLRVPYVLYAQSFGPFHSWFSRWWMRKLVRHSSGTWARESASKETLINMGAPADKMDVVADAAFGVRPKPRQQKWRSLASLRPQEYVAISVRSLVATGHAPEFERNYRESFQELIEWIAREKKLKVALVAHTTGPLLEEDDRVTSRIVYESLAEDAKQQTLLVEEDLSPADLAGLYGDASLVLATRFHAVVLALCGGCPVVAIPYFGLKTQGALRDLGLEDFVVEVKEITFPLLKAKVETILAGGNRLRDTISRINREQFQAAMHSGKRLAILAEPPVHEGLS